MTEQSNPTGCISMSESYAENSQVQLGAIETCIGRQIFQRALKRSLAKKRDSEGSIVTIVDYGCADGTNSMKILRKLVKIIQNRDSQAAIRLVFCDLPSNDWESLTENLQPLSIFERITIEYVKGSFYDQLLPNSSVDLAICCSAIHWLSKTPCFQPALAYSWAVDKESCPQKHLWDAQMKADLEIFYKHRSHELRPGAELVVVSSGAQPGLSNIELIPVIGNWNRILYDALDKPDIGLLCNPTDFVVPRAFREKKDFEAGLSSNQLEIFEYSSLNSVIDFSLNLLDSAEYRLHYLHTATEMHKAFLEPYYRCVLSTKCGIHDEYEVSWIIDSIFAELQKAFLPEKWEHLRDRNRLFNSVFYHALAIQRKN